MSNNDGPESLKELMRIKPAGAASKPARPRKYWFAIGTDANGNRQQTDKGSKADAEWLADEFRKDGYTDVEVRWSYSKR